MNSNVNLSTFLLGTAAGAALVVLGVQAGRSARVRGLLEDNARLQQRLSDLEHFEDDSYLTNREREAIRQVFDRFADETGTISASQLQELNASLGQPLSEASLAAAMQAHRLEPGSRLTYAEFLQWWQSPGAAASRLRPQFELMMTKLQAATVNTGMITARPVGEPNTFEFRVAFYYKDDSGAERQISPWHDVPLYASRGPVPAFNFLCEIPRYSRKKFEVAKGEPMNCIKQDVRNGVLREYAGDMFFNYGAFPQTWEDPAHVNPDTQCIGDNDPLDVLEIGTRPMQTGEIAPVKVLGVLAMIDDGETDWKVIVIQTADPLCERLNSIDDVNHVMPGALDSLREWLRNYKTWVGKPANAFALDERFMDATYALSVIEETHQSWKELVATGATTA